MALYLMQLRYNMDFCKQDIAFYTRAIAKNPSLKSVFENCLNHAHADLLEFSNRYYTRVLELKDYGKNFITEKEAVSLIACLEGVGKNVFQIGKKGLVSILYEYVGYNFRVEKDFDTGELEIAVWAKDTYVKDIQFSSFKD